MLLTVNATSGAAWCCWWLCRKVTEKVSCVTIVLRNIKRARCHHQKSQIWLASHRFPTPGLTKSSEIYCFTDETLTRHRLGQHSQSIADMSRAACAWLCNAFLVLKMLWLRICSLFYRRIVICMNVKSWMPN